MRSYDYDAVVIDCSIYCTGCVPEGTDMDSEEVSPIFASSEWDSYPVCDVCHTEHDYVNLTDDGRRELWRRSLPQEWQKETENGGQLARYAWPGGYPLYYLTEDGYTICPSCANKHDTSDNPVARDVNWEDADLYCDDCSERIESAYAEPED